MYHNSKEMNIDQEPGLDDVHVCMDTIPADPTPTNCRMYSIDPKISNVLFELRVLYAYHGQEHLILSKLNNKQIILSN